jgi:hypothetical protein
LAFSNFPCKWYDMLLHKINGYSSIKKKGSERKRKEKKEDMGDRKGGQPSKEKRKSGKRKKRGYILHKGKDA